MRRRLALAMLGGAFAFLGYAGFEIWPLAFVAYVPLLIALEGVSARQAVMLGAVMGLVGNLGGYYWLVGTIHDFGGQPIWLAVPAYAALCLYQGGSFAVAAWLVHLTRRRGVPVLLALPLSIVAAEKVWPLLFPFFMGNSLHGLTTIAQIADLGGPLLLSALLGVVSAAAYGLLRRPRAWRSASVALALVVASLVYGAIRIRQIDRLAAASPAFEVGMVQTSMDIFAKGASSGEGLRRHVVQSIELEAKAHPDLVIWPESAYDDFVPVGVSNVRGLITDDAIHAPLLFGGLRVESQTGRQREYNSAFLADRDGNILGSYDKICLLPFGESMPFGETFPWLYDVSPNTGRFTPGSHQRPLALDGWRLSVIICYEDILPGFVRRAVREGDPHLLVNITNDAWFGDSVEPWIHLALAQSRSIEERRYLVRSTNSGVSAIIDACGRVVAHAGVFTRENLSGTVRMMQGRTVYSAAGDWPGWIGIAFCLWHVGRGLVASRSEHPATCDTIAS